MKSKNSDIDLKFDSVEVTAKSRILNTKWSLDAIKDVNMVNMANLDILSDSFDDMNRAMHGKRVRDVIQKDWDARCKGRLLDEIDNL
jgi:hypothetical protein